MAGPSAIDTSRFQNEQSTLWVSFTSLVLANIKSCVKSKKKNSFRVEVLEHAGTHKWSSTLHLEPFMVVLCTSLPSVFFDHGPPGAFPMSTAENRFAGLARQSPRRHWPPAPPGHRHGAGAAPLKHGQACRADVGCGSKEVLLSCNKR